jgi:hypothetical protein
MLLPFLLSGIGMTAFWLLRRDLALRSSKPQEKVVIFFAKLLYEVHS